MRTIVPWRSIVTPAGSTMRIMLPSGSSSPGLRISARVVFSPGRRIRTMRCLLVSLVMIPPTRHCGTAVFPGPVVRGPATAGLASSAGAPKGALCARNLDEVRHVHDHRLRQYPLGSGRSGERSAAAVVIPPPACCERQERGGSRGGESDLAHREGNHLRFFMRRAQGAGMFRASSRNGEPAEFASRAGPLSPACYYLQ